MLDTPPTTPAGLALMLAAFLYSMKGQSVGTHFSDPESWFISGDTASQGTLYALLPMLWSSPAAAERDAAAVMARVDAEREALLARNA